MAIPQETDPSGNVVRDALGIAARVLAEDEVNDLGEDIHNNRHSLKTAIRHRQDCEDATILADGALNSREAATDREIIAFGTRAEGRLVMPGKPGNEHPEFSRLFAARAPSALLPAKREDRSRDLVDLAARINLRETAPELKKDAATLLTAIQRELAAVATSTKARNKLDQAFESESFAKTAVILACRACSGHLQARLAAQPARVRRLLGQKLGGGSKAKSKKKKTEEETPPTPPTDADPKK